MGCDSADFPISLRFPMHQHAVGSTFNNFKPESFIKPHRWIVFGDRNGNGGILRMRLYQVSEQSGAYALPAVFRSYRKCEFGHGSSRPSAFRVTEPKPGRADRSALLPVMSNEPGVAGPAPIGNIPRELRLAHYFW